MTDLQETDLDTARYCSLRTWRRDGTAVATPVWFARGGDRYLVFSAGDAGKVKRLRRSNRAEVAPCDVAGKPLGSYRPAVADVLMSSADIATALSTLRAKYGLVMRLLDLGSRLTGRFNKRAYIAFSLS